MTQKIHLSSLLILLPPLLLYFLLHILLLLFHIPLLLLLLDLVLFFLLYLHLLFFHILRLFLLSLLLLLLLLFFLLYLHLLFFHILLLLYFTFLAELNDKKKIVDATVIDLGDGTYIAPYNLSISGKYVMRASMLISGLNATYFKNIALGRLSGSNHNEVQFSEAFVDDKRIKFNKKYI